MKLLDNPQFRNKILFTDVNRACLCVDWVRKHRGPVVRVQDNSICGLGWQLWIQENSYLMELTQPVDSHTHN